MSLRTGSSAMPVDFLKVVVPLVGVVAEVDACFRTRCAAKDGDDVVDVHHKKDVVRFQIDGNRILRVEENLVVLANREVFVVGDLSADLDDSTGDRRNLGLIGENDATLGCLSGFVLPDQDPAAQRFDKFLIAHD